MSMGLDYVSVLRPVTAVLCVRQMIYENGERQWSDIGRRKPKARRKPCRSATFPSEISHGLNGARTRVSAVRGQRLTALATSRSKATNYFNLRRKFHFFVSLWFMCFSLHQFYKEFMYDCKNKQRKCFVLSTKRRKLNK
jgi:hypothetical protein